MAARERSLRRFAASRVPGKAGEAASVGALQIVVLNSFTGNKFELSVMADATIDTVKCKIFDKEGILPDQQYLIFGTILLETGCILTDYNIIEGSTINVVRTPAKMRVFVGFWVSVRRFRRRRVFLLYVWPFERIEVVKAMIQRQEGIPPKEQRLSVGGTRLEDDRTFFEYDIQNDSMLDVEIKYEWLIRMVDGTILLFFFDSDTIDTVKTNIHDSVGIPPDQQRLSTHVSGDELPDDWTLSEAGLFRRMLVLLSRDDMH